MRSGSVELSDGGRLAFDVAGEGPDVVLLHPGLWDRRTWDRQMTTFPAAGYRVTRYDARGYGASTRPDARPYSHVRDLEAQYDIKIPEDPAYATVGGFVLDQLGFIPSGGESFVYEYLRFTIAEMDGKRVARVKMERIKPSVATNNNDSETPSGKPAKSAVSRS